MTIDMWPRKTLAGMLHLIHIQLGKVDSGWEGFRMEYTNGAGYGAPCLTPW